MLRIQLEMDALSQSDVDGVLAVLTEKVSGDLPDKRDTATLAYVVLRSFRTKLHVAEHADLLVSNDAAAALQNELRLYLASKGSRAVLLDTLNEMLRQINTHLTQVEEDNARKRAEFVRRNTVPVRERRTFR